MYVGDGTVYWIDDCFVSRMAGEESFLDGKLTVIDGIVTHEIGDLGESDTNHIILYNTARAKNPATENGKFFAEAPDIPDEKIAQMQYCLSTRIRSQAAKSIRAGIGSAIGKIFPKAKFGIDKSQIRALI